MVITGFGSSPTPLRAERIYAVAGEEVLTATPGDNFMSQVDDSLTNSKISTHTSGDVIVSGNDVRRYSPDGTQIWVNSSGGISGKNIGVTESGNVITGSNGTVIKLDGDVGDIIWENNLDGRAFFTPIGGGRVGFGVPEGESNPRLGAIDTDGNVIDTDSFFTPDGNAERTASAAPGSWVFKFNQTEVQLASLSNGQVDTGPISNMQNETRIKGAASGVYFIEVTRNGTDVTVAKPLNDFNADKTRYSVNSNALSNSDTVAPSAPDVSKLGPDILLAGDVDRNSSFGAIVEYITPEVENCIHEEPFEGNIRSGNVVSMFPEETPAFPKFF